MYSRRTGIHTHTHTHTHTTEYYSTRPKLDTREKKAHGIIQSHTTTQPWSNKTSKEAISRFQESMCAGGSSCTSRLENLEEKKHQRVNLTPHLHSLCFAKRYLCFYLYAFNVCLHLAQSHTHPHWQLLYLIHS